MRKPIVGFWCILIVDAVLLQVNSENCDGEIENALRKLLSPSEYPTLQLRALRRQLLHKMQQALEKFEEEEDPNLKSSLSALARWNNLPEKRNLESLARAGYIKTLPDVEDANDSFKRSIANLAKNGQLPHHDDKRGIQSLARNGEIHTKPTSRQDQLDEELYKRNVASLARSYNFPVFNQKRSLSSLARAGDLPNFYKRNIAALARDGALGKRLEDSYFTEDGTENIKRNIASIKAQYNPKFKRSASRTKREIDYDNLEYSSPVYQNTNVFDYEEMIKELTGEYPEPEKRFLGRLPQMGKPKSTVSPKVRFP
ncbi:neuropeptide-like 1 isoform X2 [Aethina tumida]|uniref:neuropeptide-like 1 isoform X2 n=1 Tax=Aethina tumida TaxID=116153 RepID=UPI00096B3730|nr:neuropeptide-like 1 isoform X2 [Aethina tumida]